MNETKNLKTYLCSLFFLTVSAVVMMLSFRVAIDHLLFSVVVGLLSLCSLYVSVTQAIKWFAPPITTDECMFLSFMAFGYFFSVCFLFAKLV